MKVKYEKEMFNVFMEYFRKLLDGYMQNKEEDIFLYLMRRLKEELNGSIAKISYSIQFLSFYHAVEHVKKTKVATERENVFERIEEFRDILIEFLKSETFPVKLIDESIYSSDVLKEEKWIYSNFSRVYDNPDKLLNSFKKEVNKFLVKSIIDVAISLDKMGALDGMLNVSNFKCKRQYAEKLRIEKGEPVKTNFAMELFEYLKDERKISNPENVQDIFSYKYLENLKTEQLVFINLFWVNKFAKMVENILFYSTFFANRKTLLYGVKKGEISKETIHHFLDIDKGDEKTETLLFEFKKIYEVEGYETAEYAKDDIEAIRPMYELLALSYTLKDLCFYSALETEGKDKSIKNYGIVEESKKNRYTYAYVWDIPHMNLPITIHCSKTNFIYYYESIRKETKLRTYIGSDDFFGKDRLWKNSFLYPINPDKVEYLKEKSKINNQLKHVLFLQTGIWPEHMRDKNGKVTKRYISIDDVK